jgi:hypothetical protein
MYMVPWHIYEQITADIDLTHSKIGGVVICLGSLLLYGLFSWV